MLVGDSTRPPEPRGALRETNEGPPDAGRCRQFGGGLGKHQPGYGSGQEDGPNTSHLVILVGRRQVVVIGEGAPLPPRPTLKHLTS